MFLTASVIVSLTNGKALNTKEGKIYTECWKSKSHLRITVILIDCIIMLCLLPRKPEERIPTLAKGSKSIQFILYLLYRENFRKEGMRGNKWPQGSQFSKRPWSCMSFHSSKWVLVTYQWYLQLSLNHWRSNLFPVLSLYTSLSLYGILLKVPLKN